jgi:hypothetical protein
MYGRSRKCGLGFIRIRQLVRLCGEFFVTSTMTLLLPTMTPLPPKQALAKEMQGIRPRRTTMTI